MTAPTRVRLVRVFFRLVQTLHLGKLPIDNLKLTRKECQGQHSAVIHTRMGITGDGGMPVNIATA